MVDLTITREIETKCKDCRISLVGTTCRRCESTGYILEYIDIDCQATYYSGCETLYDPSFGNYLPGDSPDFDIDSAIDSVTKKEVILTSDEEEELYLKFLDRDEDELEIC